MLGSHLKLLKDKSFTRVLDYGLLTGRLPPPPGPCQLALWFLWVSLLLWFSLGILISFLITSHPPHQLTQGWDTCPPFPHPSLPIIRSPPTLPAWNSAESFPPCLDHVDGLLFKGFIYNFCVHRCVCAHTCVILYVPCVRVFGGQNRALESPGNRVTGSYELPGI